MATVAVAFAGTVPAEVSIAAATSKLLGLRICERPPVACERPSHACERVSSRQELGELADPLADSRERLLQVRQARVLCVGQLLLETPLAQT